MEKRLQDLTKHEWDTLFPIELVAHDPNWKVLFEKERQLINEKVGDKFIAIEHVGSTSIPNIKAKPYIDISIEIPFEHLFNEEIITALESLNYHYFRQSSKTADYMVSVKGYHLNGLKEQIFHIHMCPPEHEILNQILFRDYLIAHPERARAYELLKTTLAVQFRNDRSGFRMAKDEFMAETMAMIKEQTGS